jgi:hypothetical protein
MERATHGGWRGVYGKDCVAGGGAIEVVRALGAPGVHPLCLDVVEGGLLRDSGHTS